MRRYQPPDWCEVISALVLVGSVFFLGVVLPLLRGQGYNFASPDSLAWKSARPAHNSSRVTAEEIARGALREQFTFDDIAGAMLDGFIEARAAGEELHCIALQEYDVYRRVVGVYSDASGLVGLLINPELGWTGQGTVDIPDPICLREDDVTYHRSVRVRHTDVMNTEKTTEFFDNDALCVQAALESFTEC